MPSILLDTQNQPRHPQYNTGARPRPLALQPTLLVGDDGEVLPNQCRNVDQPAPQIWSHRGLTKQFSRESIVSSICSSSSTITRPARPNNGDQRYSALNPASPSPQIWAHRAPTKQFSRETTVSSTFSSAPTFPVNPGHRDRRDSVDTQRGGCAIPEFPRKSNQEINTSWASHSVFDTPFPYAELCLTDHWHILGQFLIVHSLKSFHPMTDNLATDPGFRGSIFFEVQTNAGHLTHGVPLLECINQVQNPGYLKGSEDGPPKTWKTKAIGNPKTVIIEVTWPGYPDMFWRFPLTLDNEGLSKRSIAAGIASLVHQLISAVEMHEKSLLIDVPYDPSLIGQIPIWRLGGRGTVMEKLAKMNLVSLDWAYANVFHPQFSLTLEG